MGLRNEYLKLEKGVSSREKWNKDCGLSAFSYDNILTIQY